MAFLAAYLMVGVIHRLIYLRRETAPWSVQLLITPGLITLWPLMVRQRAHFYAWLTLAVLLPTILITGLSKRRTTTPVNRGITWEALR
jgi:hypothetical protein